MDKPSSSNPVIHCTAVVGSEGVSSFVVNNESLADTIGSGDVKVLSTPYMSALMEGAACNAVAGKLSNETDTTVGVAMNIKHIAASPLGANVRAKAAITEIRGKLIIFKVEAFDDKDKIGEGTHERVVVNKARFLENAYKKSSHNIIDIIYTIN